MTTAIKNKINIMELASDFGGFAKRHKWVSRYDLESDAFSITAPKISKDASIVYFDNEIAFYMTKDNRVEGVFIEYFKSNFIEHHRDLRGVLKNINKLQNTEESLVKLDKSEINKIIPGLEEAIKVSLAGRLDLSPQG